MLRRFAVDHIKPYLSDDAWQKVRRAGGAPAAGPAKTSPTTPAKPALPKPLGRAEMIDAIGRVSTEGLGANSTLPKGVWFVSPDPDETVVAPTMTGTDC